MIDEGDVFMGIRAGECCVRNVSERRYNALMKSDARTHTMPAEETYLHLIVYWSHSHAGKRILCVTHIQSNVTAILLQLNETRFYL